MANAVARLGDTSDHGGAIVSSAARTTVEGALVARVGDILDCPLHGANPIVTGSPRFTCEGELVARTTSVAACGATILGGATKTFCE
jgi:uncharacterized Zn-binding protein involved in type VI secretion